MGDAGPPSPPLGLTDSAGALGTAGAQNAPPPREIKVLVTGFGPFKSFLVNPSWLIASALPNEIYPTPTSSGPPAYKINIIVHSSAVRVSYSSVSEVMPKLISKHDPDFILHIGVAGGRDCYSLETRAHRDGYRIKDVDDKDGFSRGESHWKKEGVPDVLLVGWDEADVLRRWERGVEEGLKERGFLGPVSQTGSETASTSAPARGSSVNLTSNSIWGPGATAANVAAAVAKARAEENRKRGVVKLSRDAGRFLCEYALFESLSVRWIDAHRHKHPHLHPHLYEHSEEEGHLHLQPEVEAEAHQKAHPEHEAQASIPKAHLEPATSLSSSQEQEKPGPTQREIVTSPSTADHTADPDHEPDPEIEARKKHLAHDRLGKVAFLHVPGWTGVEDINRGLLVAEEAIRALVASWEDGLRRPLGYGGPGASHVGAPSTLDGGAFTSQHSEAHGQDHGQRGGVVVGGSSGIAWRA